ncbi:MAG: hypothetical protein EAZ53_01390 [Bacteroidetes bacterium]|nr:MAG: hypothetical protein EAZ53_01390 [Bacteroidota bacterium]
MNSIKLFNTEPFINALKAFFAELKVPIDYLADEPASPVDVLGERFKANNEAHQLIADVYALGMVNDAIFEGTETFKNLAQVQLLKADYDGLLIFGVTLHLSFGEAGRGCPSQEATWPKLQELSTALFLIHL